MKGDNPITVYTDGPLRMSIDLQTMNKKMKATLKIFDDHVEQIVIMPNARERIWAPLSMLSSVRVGFVYRPFLAYFMALVSFSVLIYMLMDFKDFFYPDSTPGLIALSIIGFTALLAVVAFYASRTLTIRLGFCDDRSIVVRVMNSGGALKSFLTETTVDEIVDVLEQVQREDRAR